MSTSTGTSSGTAGLDNTTTTGSFVTATTTGNITTSTTGSIINITPSSTIVDDSGNQAATVILALLGGIILIAVCTKLLRDYANWKKTAWYALATTWLNWFMAVSIVVLIPVDVSSTMHASCVEEAAKNSTDGKYPEDCEEPWVHFDREALVIIWNMIYWITYVMCWVIVPVMQSYVLAGHFHWHHRMIRAVKENAIIYGVGGIIGLILGIWIAAKIGIKDPSVLIGIAMAASNAYGLAIVILLLGYGLAEVPRKFWRKTDREGLLRYYRYKVFVHYEQYIEAEKELENAMKLVKKHDDQVKPGDDYRQYIDVIVSKCPPQYKNVLRGEGDIVLEYGKLVSLHNRINSALHNFNVSRTLYESNLKRNWELEDIMASNANRDHTIHWSFPKSRKQFLTPIVPYLNTFEWYWKIYCETWAFRAVTVIAILLSVSVVWSETTLVIKSTHLSIFYWLIQGPANTPYFFQLLFVFIPVSYIAYTAYWSLFQLRIFNFYRIVPKNSDANSLLFSAYYLARIIPSMTYNFLFMVGTEISAFERVLGQIKLTLIGYDLNFFFPLALCLLCIGNVFNLYSRLFYSCAGFFKCCWKVNRYDFDEDWNDERIDKGKEIVAREKELKREGALSIDRGINLLQEKIAPKAVKKVKNWLNFGRKNPDKPTTGKDKFEMVNLEEV